jgi:hypothetical protein
MSCLSSCRISHLPPAMMGYNHFYHACTRCSSNSIESIMPKNHKNINLPWFFKFLAGFEEQTHIQPKLVACQAYSVSSIWLTWSGMHKWELLNIDIQRNKNISWKSILSILSIFNLDFFSLQSHSKVHPSQYNNFQTFCLNFFRNDK